MSKIQKVLLQERPPSRNSWASIFVFDFFKCLDHNAWFYHKNFKLYIYFLLFILLGGPHLTVFWNFSLLNAWGSLLGCWRTCELSEIYPGPPIYKTGIPLVEYYLWLIFFLKMIFLFLIVSWIYEKLFFNRLKSFLVLRHGTWKHLSDFYCIDSYYHVREVWNSGILFGSP